MIELRLIFPGMTLLHFFGEFRFLPVGVIVYLEKHHLSSNKSPESAKDIIPSR